MRGIIKDVLEYFEDANLHSESARDAIAEEIIKRLDTKEYYYSRDLVSTKTKDSPFTSVEETIDTEVNMDAFVCDDSDQPVQDKVFAQGQGMLFVVNFVAF